MIDTILFDLDGTLINIPQNYILDVVRNALERLDKRNITKNDILDFWYGKDRDI